jgi:cell division transport system ATP-binding protein
VIEAHHLSKAYSRGLYALRDLTLSVSKGEFVFLTGPSGAGKSTFLRLLLVQERATEGSLVVSPRDWVRLSGLQTDSNSNGAREHHVRP